MILYVAISVALADGLIRFVAENPTQPVVVVETEDSQASVSIHRVNRSSGEQGPAIFARVDRSEAGYLLRPKIPLSEGGLYRVVLRGSDGATQSVSYEVPKTGASKPQVVRIEPASGKVPANLLKFYIYFDQPMREGRQIFEQFTIFDEEGKAVDAPWRRQEIWNPDATRLTLLIHPGRIKQGVNLREELGPVLKPYSTYRLMIDRKLKSARGVEIGSPIAHEFSTGPECYQIVDPGRWELVIPSVGSTDALQIRPVRALDHALVRHQIVILNSEHEAVQSIANQIEGAELIEIRPQEPWKDQDYYIEIGELLEDLAGNTRIRVFDTDLTKATPNPGRSHLKFHPTLRS